MTLRIERIHVQGFRSLRDTALIPGRFSVLIGPNGAGKSNVADAYAFVADVYRDGLDRALQDRGGFPSVAFRRKPGDERRIAVDIEARLPLNDVLERFPVGALGIGSDANIATARALDVWVRHHFSITGIFDGMTEYYQIEREEVSVGPSGDDVVVYLRGNRNASTRSFYYSIESDPSEGVWKLVLNSLVSDGKELKKIRQGQVYLESEELAISRFRSFSPVVDAYVAQVSRIRAYAIDPGAARQPGIPSPSAEMASSGFNLPSLLRDIQARDELWSSFMTAFYGVAPGWGEIEISPRGDGRLEIWFQEPDVDRPWSAAEMSDGTVHALGILAALNDHRPPLVVIEEPENFLHPWALRTFVDACRTVVGSEGGKQVILTTHSPVLLDYVRPEIVQVVWREDGGTRIGPLTEQDPDALSDWEAGIASLSRIVDSGSVLGAVPSAV